MKKSIVSELSITKLEPVIAPKYKHLRKGVHFVPHEFSMLLTGVNNAEANAIIRVAAGELLVKAMVPGTITTTNAYILQEQVTNRIRQIPLDQSINNDAQFTLAAENNTAGIITIYSREIRRSKGSGPFCNENIPLFTLEPGTTLSCDISVAQNSAMSPGCGMYCVAVLSSSLCEDEVLIDLRRGAESNEKGISSSVANGKVWRVAFRTNGTIHPYEIVRRSCDDIIFRAQNILSLVPQFASINNDHTLTIDGETDTIGNLFMRGILAEYPDIKNILYECDDKNYTMTLRLNTDRSLTEIFTRVTKHIVDLFTEIKKSIK